MAVGAGGNLSNPEKLVNGVRELGTELEAVVDATRAPPEGNTPVGENVSRCLSGQFILCDGGCNGQRKARCDGEPTRSAKSKM